jgi:peptidoglycan/xylan/chitin deacetylase (PgdA/CDA1 family)
MVSRSITRPVSELGKDALQRCLLREAFLWRLPRGSDCALTFDDGPHERYTPRVLELLALHAVKASFFLIGRAALRAPWLVRQITEQGHCVASHTLTHRRLPTLNRIELQNELDGCRRVIRDVAGVDTCLVRPPWGRVDAASLFWMRKWKYRIVHWSKTYSDYLQDGSAALLDRAQRIGLASRDIVLFHDNNPYTIEVLGRMLPEWRAQGRTFARL